jgi:hypothetical protein
MHYNYLVLIPKDTPIDKISSTVDEILEPFNENKEPESEEAPCWYCSKYSINDRVRKACSEKFGKDFETECWRKSLIPSEDTIWNSIDKYDELTKDYFQFAKDLANTLDPIDPNCIECGGIGIYKPVMNPNGIWDWYVIGGRWHGDLTDNEQESQNEFLHSKKDLHIASEISKNILTVEDVIKNNYESYGIIAFDGEVFSKDTFLGRAFSFFDDEKEFEQKFQDFLLNHKDCLAVSLDIHC